MTRDQMLVELNDVLNNDHSNGVWGEPTLLRYLAEGQDKFCEDTGFWIDADTFTVRLKAGIQRYQIPDRVIEVKEIWLGATRLGKYSHSLGGVVTASAAFPVAVLPGPPSLWKVDEGTGFIVLDKVPTVAEHGLVLSLHVWRYSLRDLAAEAAEPELPPRFQRACVEWAAYKCFNHHDMEAQEPVKAKDHHAAYLGYVTDGKKALRRLHGIDVAVVPDSAYRT